MTTDEAEVFLSEWNSLNKHYQDYCPKNSIGFPEPLQKLIVSSLFEPTLEPNPNSTYDFVDNSGKNVELKSSTRKGGGCTPFEPSQINCDRIIYFEVNQKIGIFELCPNDVAEVKGKIQKKQNQDKISISLRKYKKNAIKKMIIPDK